MRMTFAAIAAAALLGAAGPALAVETDVPISAVTTGGATTNVGDYYTLTSTASPATFSIMRFVIDPSLTLNFGDLSYLGFEYDVLAGGIGGGSLRTVVVTDGDNDGNADGQFLIHLGPAGTFTDPTLGHFNTGNLLGMFDLGRYDLSGIGGSHYTDYHDAFGTAEHLRVLRVSLVNDTFGPDRTFGIDRNDFTLRTTADLGVVPEPSTWALMIVGFGTVGALLRRQRYTFA